MKKVLFIVSILFLFTSCSLIRNDRKIVNYEGKRQKLDYSKHRVYVLFSTVGCHNCHQSLNEYFEENNLYSNDSIEIIGYIGMAKGSLNNKVLRKYPLVAFNKYYPNIKKVYFSEEDKDRNIIFLSQKLPNYQVPAVISIKGDAAVFVGVSELFQIESKRYIVNKNLKEQILFQ